MLYYGHWGKQKWQPPTVVMKIDKRKKCSSPLPSKYTHQKPLGEDQNRWGPLPMPRPDCRKPWHKALHWTTTTHGMHHPPHEVLDVTAATHMLPQHTNNTWRELNSVILPLCFLLYPCYHSLASSTHASSKTVSQGASWTPVPLLRPFVPSLILKK